MSFYGFLKSCELRESYYYYYEIRIDKYFRVFIVQRLSKRWIKSE